MRAQGNRTLFLASLSFGTPKTLNAEDARYNVLVAAKAIVAAIGLTVKNWAWELYEPQGWTLVVFLAESHFIFTAYPEHNLLDVELASCTTVDKDKFYRALKEFLPAARHRYPSSALLKTEDGWGIW